MTEWCMIHPWMTFFIALAIIEALRAMVVSYNGQQVDDED